MEPEIALVSTHSRLKAAASVFAGFDFFFIVSTHSRLKAAADFFGEFVHSLMVSTHSRLKAAANRVQSVRLG